MKTFRFSGCRHTRKNNGSFFFRASYYYYRTHIQLGFGAIDNGFNAWQIASNTWY